MTTVLMQGGPVEVPAGPGAEGELWLSASEAEALSGWALKPEGLCRGEVCLPVPAGRTEEFVRDDQINLAAFWRRLDKPLAHSRDGEVWAFGDGADDRGASLSSLEAPDFTLPDLQGREHSLADYRGKKVFLATWASW